MSASPNLKLPYLDPNQNQKTVTHNAALTVLDALVNLHVASTTLQVPPASPADGQCWIVASGATGAWMGKDLNVAAWQDGAWTFYAPNPGFVAYVDALQGALMWNGTAWVSLIGAITALALVELGIGTAADAANPLSAKLNAALFAAQPTTASPPGSGDVRLKLSKQATANTASLLLQDNFAGRAEIGLLGDDNLHVKVSPDGTTFTDALVIAGQGLAAFAFSPTAPTPPQNDASTKLATTAYADRAAAAGNLTRTQVNDAAYAMQATDRVVAVTALTAARILTLPAAAAYPQGATLTVVDESGACSATNTITVARSGADTVNGAGATVLSTPYAYAALESNGANKWTIVDAPAPVVSVAGRTGAVSLAVADVAGAAPLASPALAGTPTAPNAVAGTNSSQVATTAFVAASFVTYVYASANYATAANATLTGTPTAPTQAQGDNSTRLATTAYADRAAAAGNLARHQVADAAYAVQPTDRVVAVTALTAPRAITLPAASAFPQGATLTVVDESGACSVTTALTVARVGTDTINGAASAVLSTPYAYLALESNGANKWTVVDSPGGVASAMNGGPLAGFRNLVINGNFYWNQWQYAGGTSIAAQTYGFHDRWGAGASACAYTFAQATPDTVVTITAGSLMQVVEALNVAGGTYTLSWSGTATGRIFPSGTAAGSRPVFAASPIVLAGASAGVALCLEFTAGTLGLVQLEPGPVATPFERRPLGLELTLCQRYLEKTYPAAMAPATKSTTGATNLYLTALNSSVNPSITYYIPFKVPKRTAPTLTLYSPNSGATGKGYDNSAGADVGASPVAPGEGGFAAFSTMATQGVVNIYWHWLATAELTLG